MSDGTTRRGALAGLLGIAAGAVGIGYAARDGGSSAESASRPAPARRRRELTLYGRDWRLHSAARVPGELPAAGDRATPQGRLVDGRDRTLGSFRSGALAGMPAAVELHTFELADGSIFGVGAGASDGGTFAVIGGTDRYAGATGSYSSRQSLRELGGDGTAEFTFTLETLEA